MKTDDGKPASIPDKRTQAIRQAWADFSRSLGQIKTRITTLKTTKEENERDAKLKSIQQAINEHR